MYRILYVLLALLIVSIAVAQDSCEALSTDTVNTILENCSLELAQACTVDESDVALDGGRIEAPALLTLNGSIDDNLAIWLVGSASLEDVEISEAQARFDARNKAGYNVNLRSGPGTNFEQAGILSFDETGIADARNADGSWVRLITEQEGIVWVGANFLAVDGDVMSLPLANGDEALNSQSLTFNSSPCDDVPSGLLFIYKGLVPSEIQVNELDLQLTGTVAFLSLEEMGIKISVIEGQVQVNREESVLLETGQATIIAEEEGEIVGIDLALLAHLPLTDLLDIPVTCIAEMSADSDLRDLPEADAEVSLSVVAGQYGTVELQNTDAFWWRVSVDSTSGWVESEAISLIGDCNEITVASDPSQANNLGVPSGNPETVMFNYLQARVDGDVGTMQTLSCAAWDGQAAIQAQSFRAMNASLENVACSTTENLGASATVFCSGNILTQYNGATRTWDLGNYHMVVEAGEWRMCGEA